MALNPASVNKSFRSFWSKMSLSRRVAIITAVMIAGTALVEGVLLITVSAHVVEGLETQRIEQRLKSIATQLATRIQEARRVPLILAGTPPIERIAYLAEGGKPQPGESLEVWRGRLAIIFRSIMQADPSLQQARLIGIADGGREIVRVNRTAEGIEIVKDADLQRKGHRSYFQEALGLHAGEVFVSTCDVNIENGKVEHPFRPMLRAATPIFDTSGKLFGLIVVNASPEVWMRQMADLGGFTAHFPRKLMLVNHDGDFVYRSDGGPIFSPQRFQDAWPALASVLKPGRTNKLSVDEDGHVIAATRVQYDPDDANKFVVIATEADASAVFGGTTRLIILGVLVALALCAIGLLAAYLVTSPLRGLMAAARRIAEGKVDVAALEDDDPNPEVGELGEALRLMKEAVERRDASLRSREAHLRAIIDNSIDGLITIDRNGIIRRYNPACEHIFGYTAAEAVGQNISMLMPHPDSDRHDSYMQRYDRTGEARFMGVQREVMGRHKSGRLIDLDVAVSEIKVEDEVLFSGFIRDITERKKIERLKSEFISTVSHELRTPLTSILGALALLRSGSLGKVPSKVGHMVELAHANGGRLSALIDDILDIEKIEAGAMEFRQAPEQLDGIIRQAVDHISGFAKAVGVDIKVDGLAPDIVVNTDRDRLLQVFANLLSNAVKFSPRGATVAVGTTMMGDTVRVSVTDQGAGIPEDFHARIFQKFAQADSSDSRQKGGTGLGLSISKAIVEKLGGKIDFKSEPGAGTTFYFDLPAGRGSVRQDMKCSA